MTRKMKWTVIVACMALVVGILGLAEIAAAQTVTENVHIGTGKVLHRSGQTLILDVKEGPRGPGVRKINIKSTDGITFKDRLGNVVEVFALKPGDSVSAYRRETRPAPVTITMSEVEEIKAAEPAAPPPAPKPAPAPAPEPEPQPEALPSTASPLPWIALLGLLSLTAGLALRVARRRA